MALAINFCYHPFDLLRMCLTSVCISQPGLLSLVVNYKPSGTGFAAVFINISMENFAGWKFSLVFKIVQKSYLAGFVVYILINLALVFSSVYIITHCAPAAAGSGIQRYLEVLVLLVVV